MDFDFSEREEAFRKEVRAWLEANVPDDLRGKAFASSRADVDEVRRLRAWQKTMWEAGYVGMTWPKEFGGRGAPLTEQIILFQEMARAESPQFVNRGGLSMLGPTLMKYGTPAPTSPICRHAPYSRPTRSSSTARRSGRRWPTSPTGASCSCAPTRMPRSTRASAFCSWT